MQDHPDQPTDQRAVGTSAAFPGNHQTRLPTPHRPTNSDKKMNDKKMGRKIEGLNQFFIFLSPIFLSSLFLAPRRIVAEKRSGFYNFPQLERSLGLF